MRNVSSKAYRCSIGWRQSQVAVGIRADEIDRISKNAERDRLLYPLIDKGFTKDMVNAYARGFSFDLKLPSDAYGNCVTCWKKADRKLFTVATEAPHYFEFFDRMESEYGHFKTDCKAASPDGTRKFFRRHRTTAEILAQAQSTDFQPYSNSPQLSIWDELLDIGGACDQGCEAYQ